MTYKHIPVMLKEVIEYLHPRPGHNFIDCTLGGGGYTAAIAEQVAPEGRVIAIDLDKMAIDNAKARIKHEKLSNVILVQDNFKNLAKIVRDAFPDALTAKFSGIVLDLGLSLAQLQDRSRGFSFKEALAPLNMAFGPNARKENSVMSMINDWPEVKLTRIFREYGEEKFAYQIARAIVKARQDKVINTVGQLVEIIAKTAPKKFQFKKIHPATRVFQALRIACNNELENLEQMLPQATALLKPGGRIAVVSYHSLEDRIVKRFFRREAAACLCPPRYPACRCQHKARLKIITKKVIVPTEEEVRINPSARSAKLRVAEAL